MGVFAYHKTHESGELDGFRNSECLVYVWNNFEVAQ